MTTPRRLTLELLETRAADATVCPSEVARALATAAGDPAAWRDEMAAVHDAIDALLRDGQIRLSWKGRPLTNRAGPYRIHQAHPQVEDSPPLPSRPSKAGRP